MARCSPSSPRTSGRCAPTWCAHGTHRYPMLTPIPLPPARSPVPPACGPRAYTTLLHLLHLPHLLQVWGAFWSVPMPPATGAVRFCLHRSLIFTEPLLGCVELPLHELTQDGLCTQWHPLRAKEQRGGDILGEVAVQQSNSSIATPASRHAHLRAALPRRCCSRYGGTARRPRSALRPTSAWARRRRRRTSSRTRASSTLRSTGRRPWPPSTSPVSQG